MILEIQSMQKCGNGTPMVSRPGRTTSTQYKVFSEKHKNIMAQMQSLTRGGASQVKSIDPKENALDAALDRLKVIPNFTRVI
jgi:hypothetical protein